MSTCFLRRLICLLSLFFHLNKVNENNEGKFREFTHGQKRRFRSKAAHLYEKHIEGFSLSGKFCCVYEPVEKRILRNKQRAMQSKLILRSNAKKKTFKHWWNEKKFLKTSYIHSDKRSHSSWKKAEFKKNIPRKLRLIGKQLGQDFSMKAGLEEPKSKLESFINKRFSRGF